MFREFGLLLFFIIVSTLLVSDYADRKLKKHIEKDHDYIENVEEIKEVNGS